MKKTWARWTKGMVVGMAVLAGAANAAPLTVDLASTEGYRQTCAGLPKVPAALKNDEERIAFVVCRDTALVRQIVTWGVQGMARMSQERPAKEAIMAEIRKEIDYAREEIGLTRNLLERIDLGRRKSLRLVPSEWQTDLDGDGRIAVWEKYFYAVPRRGLHPFRFGRPSDDLSYYLRDYNLDATIRVDQSDVLWALAYHQFIEGLLTNVRAFELDFDRLQLILARPELLKQAHGLINRGFLTSERMRRSVLAESGDDQEWIANPRQTDTVFPVPLDQADFALWGELLKELTALWQGRHLLPVTRGNRGLLAEFAPLCPEGSGLNLAQLYLKPPPAGTEFGLGRDAKLSANHCQRISAQRPLTHLPEMAEKAQRSGSGDLRFLRYLYWTN